MKTRSFGSIQFGLVLLVSILFLTGPRPIAALDAPPDVYARTLKLAQDWLSIMDANRFSDCYKLTGSLVKEMDTEDKWVNGLNATRATYGALVSRKVVGNTYLPNGYDRAHGEVVQFVFESEFKGSSRPQIEAVLMHHEGLTWVPISYIMQPKYNPDDDSAPASTVIQQDPVDVQQIKLPNAIDPSTLPKK